ncbi:MAG: hypothetical protein ACLSV7_09175 [Oscillospiraceae bacterium]
MVKELYQTILRETSLNVTSGEIDSIRKKSITKSGCRVYDGSYLGSPASGGHPRAGRKRGQPVPPVPCPWGSETANAGPVAGTAMDAGRFSSWRRSC